MRSHFSALCPVFLFFCELVLTAPSPLAVKRKKHIPAKKVVPKHSGILKKKIPVKKAPKAKPKPINSKGAHGSSCPARKPMPKPKKIKREEDDFGLVRRTTSEFLGFHGTTEANTKLFVSSGLDNKRLPILPSRSYNGNDAELGDGFYVTDDYDTALSFAVTSSNSREIDKKPPAKPSICMVEAVSTTTWRALPKAWIPYRLIRRKQEQVSSIECLGYDPSKTVRFSVLHAGKTQTNQFSVPIKSFDKIYCANYLVLVEQVLNK